MSNGWIAVDLDGTLALYTGWRLDGSIGQPIPKMLARVKKWRAEGREVRIFTARVGASGKPSSKHTNLDDQNFADDQRRKIQAWCLLHVGEILPVTATKDLDMIQLWDDRAVAVEENTGEAFSYRGEL